MKLFVDTAAIEEIEELLPLGIVDGVTTNPSLLAKAGADSRQVLKIICDRVGGPVSAEVVATEAEAMIQEGRNLAEIDEHIVVKVPFGRAGVTACGALAGEGVRVNVTLVFSATQGLLQSPQWAIDVLTSTQPLPQSTVPGGQPHAHPSTFVARACTQHRSESRSKIAPSAHRHQTQAGHRPSR